MIPYIQYIQIQKIFFESSDIIKTPFCFKINFNDGLKITHNVNANDEFIAKVLHKFVEQHQKDVITRIEYEEQQNDILSRQRANNVLKYYFSRSDL